MIYTIFGFLLATGFSFSHEVRSESISGDTSEVNFLHFSHDNELPMLKKVSFACDLFIRISLHGIVLFLAIALFYPVKTKAPPRMIHSLWNGLDRAYIPPGSQFKIFKPYLPAKGRVSLILDRPNNENTKNKEISYDAQNYFTPLIVNLETMEPLALVYCSSQAIADQRLIETGYEWTHPLSPGKGMARKKNEP